MADNQVNLEQLERDTNLDEGWEEVQTEKSEHDPKPQDPQTSEGAAPTEPAPEVTPATAPATPEVSQAVTDDILKALEETPFKSVPDVVKAYKSLQSETTKFREKVKPFEQLFSGLETDNGFRQFIEQATQLYRNPQLAQAYQQPNQQQGGQPDPRNYDLSTYEGLQQFQQDTIAHAQRAAFETVNQRMSGWEQQQALEKAKLEFRGKYPDQNPDEILDFVKERNGKWSLEDAYKIRDYDNLKTKMYEQARKELATKVNEASRNTPIPSAPADKPSTSPMEVMTYLQKYGLPAANKKWGDDKVRDAIKKFTEEND